MKRWDLSRILGACFVVVVVLVVYLRTMAVSLSFWDCGEFIACSHILGVPHPPGAPLYILVGRLFSLVPLFAGVAQRVNFLSVLTGALSAGVLYLVVVEVSREWFGQEGGWRGRLLGMVGGVSAGLWMAFSDTYWSNTVEAEVYAPAMLLMVLGTWLGLRWLRVRSERGGDHVLLLLLYVLYLGIAVHMTVFMVSLPVFLLVVLSDESRLRDWRLWLAGLTLVMVIGSVTPFLVVSVVVLVISLVGMQGGGQGARRWRFCFWLVFLGLLGFTVQGFIPVRSMLDPAIDENDPDTWSRFKMFLERKQYGQESMLKLMFRRKGSWGSQFGIHQRMGFWGFFRQGWYPVRWWPLVLGLGVFGMVAGWFRERRRWLYLVVLMVLCSVGLVLWMNFSDGTRGVQLEVRDRDYFFTPAYLYFSLWMGLGVSGLLWLVWRKLRGLVRELTFWALLVVFLLAPLGSLGHNYHRHDRSRNWIAHDYGYNLLNSCDQDGILFTNGDNDTFPLWYLQEVEDVRRDVRVVNLSLLNTGWYIRQLKHMEPKVAMDLTDEQIDRLMAVRLRDGSILRVQDRMIDEIITTNRWKRPIFFAVTIPDNNRRGLSDYLQMEAMVYRVLPDTGHKALNLDRTRDNLLEVYQYRGMADTTVFKSENTNRLLFNLVSAFISMAHELHSQGRTDEAIVQLIKATEVISGDWRPHAYLADLFVRSEDYVSAENHLFRALRYNPEFFILHRMLGSTYARMGELNKGMVSYQKAYQLNSESRPVVMELAEIYRNLEMTDEAGGLLSEWLSRHSEDQAARQLLRQLSSTEGGGG